MGLGKTVITLTSLVDRLDSLDCYGALVVAPKRVVQAVWAQEAQKWMHTQSLRFRIIDGSKDYRTRQAMMPADVYLVSYDNLRWLADLWTHHYLARGRYLPVNALVGDEITKLKNATAARSKAWARLRPFMHVCIGLTGTPASNGYQDLHGQYLAVDGGERLGATKDAFKARFLDPENPMAPFGRQVPKKGAEATIQDLVSDITMQMSNADYLELPPVVSNVIPLHLERARRQQYDRLEHEMWVELDSGHEVVSFNKAASMNRCLQFAQGAMYRNPGDKAWEEIHQLKLDALDEIVEEAAGKPVLCMVEFQHDAERILVKYPEWRWVSASMSRATFNETLLLWERGQLPGIIANPLSLGHGIDDLKKGPVDDLVWFGHTWSLDAYEQTIARLQRQGRTRPIRMHHLVMVDTVEEVQRDALASKAVTQDSLKAALNEYRQRRAA